MFVLEPIPQLGAMMLSLRMAKAQDGPLGSDLSALEARTKNTKSSDRAAWLEIYRGFATLLPRLVDAYAAANAPPRAAATAPMNAYRISSAATGAQAALQRSATDWASRLAQQERDLAKKAAEAAEQLPVTSIDDDTMGEIVYTYEPAELDAFWRWLAEAERLWAANNGALVAKRTQEAIADPLAELPPELVFRAAEAHLAPASPAPPRLRGQRIPNPGFFSSLGTTYRFVMSAVTAVSGLGFVATRVVGAGPLEKVLPPVLGLVFVATVIVAAITLPKQRRQTFARLRARAAETLEREIAEAVRQRLKTISDGQLSEIKKHLGAEGTRMKSFFREHAPSSPEPIATPLTFSAGLSAADVGKLRGEWKDAIDERIRQLQAEPA